MAKFTKMFSDGKVKNTLTFRGKEFNLTMGEWEDGVRSSCEVGFETQLEEAFRDDEEVINLIENYDIDMLDCSGNEEEIEEILEELNEIE